MALSLSEVFLPKGVYFVTHSMMSLGQPLWADIKILGHVSMSVGLYVSLCVCGIDIKHLGCPMLIILCVSKYTALLKELNILK